MTDFIAPSEHLEQRIEELETEVQTTEEAANAFHTAILAVINELMTLDPPTDSPEGRLLVRLAKACESYEKVRWPIEPPEPVKP